MIDDGVGCLVQCEHLVTEVAAGRGLGKALRKLPHRGSKVDHGVLIVVVPLHQRCAGHKGFDNSRSIFVSPKEVTFQVRGRPVLANLEYDKIFS